MPNRRRSDSDERDGGRKARRRPTRRRRHLYLVLDDWSFGYSIRKIDLSAADGCYAGLQPVPRPIFQLEGPSGLHVSMYFAASSGSSKIMAMHPQLNDARCFDVRSRSLVYGPRPRPADEVPINWYDNRPVSPVFIPVGDRICALWGRSLQLLVPPPPPESAGGNDDRWSWRELHAELPFDSSCATAYAAHPDGRTVFVTFNKRHFARWRNQGPEPTQGTTLCLDVADESTADRVVRGEFAWALPFDGGGYFVGELNAWVGLSESYASIDHLCACSVVTPESDSTSACTPAPTWKMSKEAVASNSLAELCMGATLVYMGSERSEFCVVEAVSVSDNHVCEGPDRSRPYDPLLRCKEPTIHPLLRLTTFSLAVDESGDLTTGNTRRLRYYSLPDSVTRPWPYMQHPVAFWL